MKPATHIARTNAGAALSFLARVGHPEARLVADAKPKTFRATELADLPDWVERHQIAGRPVAMELPTAAGGEAHWWLAARLPGSAQPSRLRPVPQLIVAAGDFVALWRLAQPIGTARAIELVGRIIGRSGRHAIGEPVPLPGTILTRQRGNGQIEKHGVHWLPGAKAKGYRVSGNALVGIGDAPAPGARGAAPAGSIYLGAGHGRWARDAYWAPSEAQPALLNFGVLVTGDSGSGKTQTLRSLIDGVVRMGHPVCIFDFKNDYADRDFTMAQKLRVHDVRRDGVPFNPLQPAAAGEDGKAQPIEHIFTVAGVLQRVFGLGDRQAAALRDAMKEAFEARGVDTKAWSLASTIAAPSFDDVVEHLRTKAAEKGGSTAAGVLDRLGPLFELGLFPATGSGFEKMAGERIVLSLFALPTDEIKAAIAEMIIIRLHGHLVQGAQPRKLTRLLVLDEAWRVSASKHLENLAREGRAFGVGLAIGTQYPGDLPEDFAGSLATKIYLKNQQPEHRAAVAKALQGGRGGKATGELAAFMETQAMFVGLIQNQQYAPFASFKLVPYYERKR